MKECTVYGCEGGARWGGREGGGQLLQLRLQGNLHQTPTHTNQQPSMAFADTTPRILLLPTALNYALHNHYIIVTDRMRTLPVES